jgi:hypothetical protein
MTRAEELLSHAARCNRLAEVCLDPAVAEKLRQLADDYWELAGQPLQHFHRIKTCPQSEAPQGALGSWPSAMRLCKISRCVKDHIRIQLRVSQEKSM